MPRINAQVVHIVVGIILLLLGVECRIQSARSDVFCLGLTVAGLSIAVAGITGKALKK